MYRVLGLKPKLRTPPLVTSTLGRPFWTSAFIFHVAAAAKTWVLFSSSFSIVKLDRFIVIVDDQSFYSDPRPPFLIASIVDD